MEKKKIQLAIQSIGLECGPEEAEKFYHFYEMVVEKNKSVNLTRITDFDAFVAKHLVDSLAPYLLKNQSTDVISPLFRENTRVLDLGTGAGFPGIPLAILFKEPSYLLVDSLKKRIAFLEECVAKLSLPHVQPLHGRAEDLARDKNYREHFNLCMSRAVANLSTLCEYALPFVKVGGSLISYKGADAGEEVGRAKRALKELGGKLALIHEFTLPSSFEETEDGAEPMGRSLICIKKERPTPAKYPRQAGAPSKKPL